MVPHAETLFNQGMYYRAHDVLEDLWHHSQVGARPLQAPRGNLTRPTVAWRRLRGRVVRASCRARPQR